MTIARLLARQLNYLLYALAISLAVTMTVLKLESLSILSVRSGSMAPVVNTGDAVIIKKQAAGSYKPGQIIAYQLPSGALITHRLISVDYNKHMVNTRGDALNSDDPAHNLSAVKGRAVAVLPGFGGFMNVQHKAWLLAVIYPLSLYMLVIEIIIFKNQTNQIYRLVGT